MPVPAAQRSRAEGLRRWQATNGVTTTYLLDLQPESATVLQAGSPCGDDQLPLRARGQPAGRRGRRRGMALPVGKGCAEQRAPGDGHRRAGAGGAALRPLRGALGRRRRAAVRLARGEMGRRRRAAVVLRARDLDPVAGRFLQRDRWPGRPDRPASRSAGSMRTPIPCVGRIPRATRRPQPGWRMRR